MDRKESNHNSIFQPKHGNPASETVYYKIGGTLYEVSTSCGGSEPLRDKIIRLMKAENTQTPNDKE